MCMYIRTRQPVPYEQAETFSVAIPPPLEACLEVSVRSTALAVHRHTLFNQSTSLRIACYQCALNVCGEGLSPASPSTAPFLPTHDLRYFK